MNPTTPTRPGPELRVRLPQVAPSVREFLATEAGGAVLLVVAATIALIWANSPGADAYHDLWETTATVGVGDAALSMTLHHWINDAAMAVFFAVVGLEINREFTSGELRDRRTVAVPALAALGGLALPAVIYLLFNRSGPASDGWGIAMSTDTAFVVGILALFGPRCPDRLRLFLLTLAIVDDIGAISVVAVFYTEQLDVGWLGIAGGILLAIWLMRWMGVWQLPPYVIAAIILWVAVYSSGVHGTLAGVLVGLLLPSAPPRREQMDAVPIYVRALREDSTAARATLAVSAAKATVAPSERLQHSLHPVSSYMIVPIFGLANAGVHLDGHTLSEALSSTVTIGVAIALLLGNAVGITAAAVLAIRTGFGVLPGGVRYGHLVGAAMLAGIGFTISLFITELAFAEETLVEQAKIGILAGSFLSAVLGTLVLRYVGERWSLCSPSATERTPTLPPRPWRAPAPSVPPVIR